MPSSADIRAGRAFVELYTKNGPLYAGLKAGQKRVSAFATGTMNAGRNLLALGGAIVGPLIASAKVFASTGDQLEKMSKRTGIAVESLSELSFAAEQGGADLGTLENGVRRMQRSLADAERGLSTPIDGLKMLGLSVEQLRGLKPEEQFQRIADGITRVEDPTKKAAAAMMLFGRSGTQLLPMLDGLAATRQQARDLGLVISTEDAKRAAKFTDQLNILRRVLIDGVFSAGSAVADVLGDMVMGIVRVVKIGADWIDNNRQLFVLLLKIGGVILAGGAALMALGAAAAAVAGIIGGLATAVSVAGTIFGAIASVIGFLLSPIGLVTAAIVGLGGYFLYASGAAGSAVDWISEKFGELLGFAKETFGGISDAMAAGDMQLAAEVMWAAIKLAWVKGTGWIRQQWAELRFFLVKLWGEVAFGVLDTMNFLWSGMVDGFNHAIDKVVDMWKGAEKWFAHGIAWVIAKLQGLNPDEVIANLNQDYNRQQTSRDSGRKERNKANQEAADARYLANEQARQEWMRGAEAKRESQLAGAEAGLEEARRRFDSARDAAAKARQAAETKKKSEPPPEAPKPGPSPTPAAAEAGKTSENAALWSQEATKILLAGGKEDPALDVQQKQLRVQEEMLQNLKSPPEAPQPAGLSFDPAMAIGTLPEKYAAAMKERPQPPPASARLDFDPKMAIGTLPEKYAAAMEASRRVRNVDTGAFPTLPHGSKITEAARIVDAGALPRADRALQPRTELPREQAVDVVQIQKDQLAVLGKIARNTNPMKLKPVVKEAVPPAK